MKAQTEPASENDLILSTCFCIFRPLGGTSFTQKILKSITKLPAGDAEREVLIWLWIKIHI